MLLVRAVKTPRIGNVRKFQSCDHRRQLSKKRAVSRDGGQQLSGLFHPIGVVGSLGLLSIPSEPDQPTLIARTSAVRSSTGIVGRAPSRELQFLPHSQDAASYSSNGRWRDESPLGELVIL
jgi:hypothetical protein